LHRPGDPNLVAARKKSRDKFLVIAFIEHTDKTLYFDLQISLANDYLRKKADEYPDTLIHAVEILNKWGQKKNSASSSIV
jgi:hypothetical protein